MPSPIIYRKLLSISWIHLLLTKLSILTDIGNNRITIIDNGTTINIIIDNGSEN